MIEGCFGTKQSTQISGSCSDGAFRYSTEGPNSFLDTTCLRDGLVSRMDATSSDLGVRGIP